MQDIIKRIKSLRIELSNVCNLSDRYVKCPLNIKRERGHLSIRLVEKIIRELADLSYRNEIGFHTFNEPFQDPRLYHVIAITKQFLPDNPILLWTNGTTLTDSLVEDFNSLSRIKYVVSVYDKETFVRINALKTKGIFDEQILMLYDYRSEHDNQDNRLSIYRLPDISLNKK